MTICDTKLYQMSENDPNTEIFKVFSVFGQTKCHSLVELKKVKAQKLMNLGFADVSTDTQR